MFSLTVALATSVYVVFEGLISLLEGTFSRKQWRMQPIRLTFCWHWGVCIGDLILLPIFNGLVIGHLKLSIITWGMLFLVSAPITWLFHAAWWPLNENAFNFMVPNWSKSRQDRFSWYKDMTCAGWMHFIFMIGALMIILAYVMSPMPAGIVKNVCLIFLIFIPFGVIEPGVVEGWPLSRKKKEQTLGIACALWSVVGVVTWCKL